MIYIVVCEEYYGGANKGYVRVFSTRKLALEFVFNDNSKLDLMVVERLVKDM